VLSYPSTISLSTQTLQYVTQVVRTYRRRIGSRWRKLTPNQQALLVLAHVRNGDTYARLAAGFGVGIATAYRYIRETVDLLAARAPSLTVALRRLAATGTNYAILDGTLVRIDRVAANKPFYSGKHRCHGMNLQGLTDPHGTLIWISDALPGATNDTAAARTHHIPDRCTRAKIVLLADTGYTRIHPSVRTPYRREGNQHRPPPPLTPGQKTANQAHNALRGIGERGFATLKAWRILTRVRACPYRITNIAKAILTLEHRPTH
jgi:DDE superfamily endonuclease